MLKLMILFVLLGLGLYVGTQFTGQQGYVLISIANKTLEMSVTTMVVFIAAFFAAFFVIEIILKKIFSITSNTWNWFTVRKLRRSRRFTNEGIIKLVEGDWKLAEKKVTRWANHHDMPLLCYLVASEAAEEMGDREKRDHYLKLASEQSNSMLAVELTKAKQQIHEGAFDNAVAILTKLSQPYPNNPRLLNMLKQCYLQLGQWAPLMELLPRLKRNKLLSLSQFEKLMEQAQIGFMQQAAETKERDVILDRWSQLPKAAKNNSKIIVVFIQALIGANADTDAFTFLKEKLKKNPSADLYSLVTELDLPDMHPAVVLLETAVNKNSNNAEAHSALARLYMKKDMLPEAQKHFEAALAMRSNVADYSYLAEVLEKQDMALAASDVSRKALALISPSE
ncbi:heme biosynthesis HemY N-terminal domain-containing protein [Vibrio sp. RC27]